MSNSDHSAVDAIFSDPAKVKVAQEHKNNGGESQGREPKLLWARSISLPDTPDTTDEPADFVHADQLQIAESDTDTTQNDAETWLLLPESTEELAEALNHHSHSPETTLPEDRQLTYQDPEETIKTVQSIGSDTQPTSLEAEKHTQPRDEKHEEHQEEIAPAPKEEAHPVTSQPEESLLHQSASSTSDRAIYLRLTQKKAEIEFETFNENENPRHLTLLARLEATIDLIREIISSGSTIARTQLEDQEILDDLCSHLDAQLAQQQKEAALAHQPLENQTRSSQNLAPYSLTISEPLRLRLLRSKLLREIPILTHSFYPQQSSNS